MRSRVSYRPYIIAALSEALLDVPDKKRSIVSRSLHMITRLVSLWLQQGHKQTDSTTERPIGIGKVSSAGDLTELSTESPDATESSVSVAALSADVERDDEVLPPFDAELVEAVALLYLCSADATTRGLALELLYGVREIKSKCYQTDLLDVDDFDHDEEDSTRVMDVIEESGPDIMTRLHTRHSESSTLRLEKTLQKC